MERRDIELYRLALFGRMVMGVAHEVDNHLSVVLGFSELIQMAPDKAQKVRENAGKVLSAGERTGSIIKAYSQYARPHPPVVEPYSPVKMLSEMMVFARYDLGRNNVVVGAPSGPPDLLRGDRRDLGLALLALMFNGSEAMAEKGGELSIDVSLEAQGWAITVTDQGTGIPAGISGKIFEEGFTTRPEPHHAGMGLPVARTLVAEAGGTLKLGDAPGGGCVATVRIPISPRGV